jgi:hypothetical protein
MRNCARVAAAAGFALITAFATVANASTVLSVSPSSLMVSSGSTFTVDVNISGVTDLYGYQFDLSFNPKVLSLARMSMRFMLKFRSEPFIRT